MGHFSVVLPYDLLRGNDAESSFSNIHNAVKSTAGVRSFRNLVDAVGYVQRMDELEKSQFLRPRFLSQQGSMYHVVGKKDRGVTFLRWWQNNASILWDVRNGVAYGLTALAVGVVRGLLDGLKALHDSGVYHGSLLSGVIVTVDHKVLFDNESMGQSLDLFKGIEKDLRDFRTLVERAMNKVRFHYNYQVAPPVSVALFDDLYVNLPRYARDLEHIRFFEFFVMNNPAFLDETELHSFCRKVIELYEQDTVNFKNFVQLQRQRRVTLFEWMNKIKNPVLLDIINFDHGKNIKGCYDMAFGSVDFTRNCFGHVRKNQYHKMKFCGDGDVLAMIMDEVPEMIPLWFLEMFETLGLVWGYYIDGCNLKEFLEKKPSSLN